MAGWAARQDATICPGSAGRDDTLPDVDGEIVKALLEGRVVPGSLHGCVQHRELAGTDRDDPDLLRLP